MFLLVAASKPCRIRNSGEIAPNYSISVSEPFTRRASAIAVPSKVTQLVAGEVEARRRTNNADQGGDHSRRGNAKTLARKVERLHRVRALELLDKESKHIQAHVCTRGHPDVSARVSTPGLELSVPPPARH